MLIRDPVVGDVEFDGTAVDLMEDPHMQRLRRIRQLGFSFFVYPGANHTRFEHSLGTMHLTGELAGTIFGKADEELQCVGLMHDIGHMPFSHQLDRILKRYLNTTHEKIGEGLIKKSSLHDIIQDSTLSERKLLEYFRGEKEGAIVTSTLGSDRLDYLARDSHYTGVAYGVIDYSRIRSKLAMHKSKIALHEQGIPGAESVLIARYFMFTSVYYHHATMIIEGMFERAVIGAIESGLLDPKELKTMTDDTLYNKLKEYKPVAGLIKNIDNRKLFKRAYYKDYDGDVTEDDLNNAMRNAGFGDNEFVAMVVNYKVSYEDMPIIDDSQEKLGMLSELSPLVRSLNDIMDKRKKVLVACDAKKREKAGAAIRKLLE